MAYSAGNDLTKEENEKQKEILISKQRHDMQNRNAIGISIMFWNWNDIPTNTIL